MDDNDNEYRLLRLTDLAIDRGDMVQLVALWQDGKMIKDYITRNSQRLKNVLGINITSNNFRLITKEYFEMMIRDNGLSYDDPYPLLMYVFKNNWPPFTNHVLDNLEAQLSAYNHEDMPLDYVNAVIEAATTVAREAIIIGKNRVFRVLVYLLEYISNNFDIEEDWYNELHQIAEESENYEAIDALN